MPRDPRIQALVDGACRALARDIAEHVMPHVERHWGDPDERWQVLKQALWRFGRSDASEP